MPLDIDQTHLGHQVEEGLGVEIEIDIHWLVLRKWQFEHQEQQRRILLDHRIQYGLNLCTARGENEIVTSTSQLEKLFSFPLDHLTFLSR